MRKIEKKIDKHNLISVEIEKKTRPDTQLPQSRAGGQKPYLRSLDHLGRSSEVNDTKS